MFRLTIVLLVAFTCSLSLRADEQDATFLAGLRRLQLFDLAERYCRRELARQELSAEREGELTVELLRTLASHAISRPAAEREPLWDQARDAAVEFRRSRPQHPRRLLVEVQEGLTLLARGELAQQEAESAADQTQAMAAAAELLRAAAKSLEDVQRAIVREIPLRRGQSPRKEELSAEELTRLEQNVSLHLARTRRWQAMCYPAGSQDRKALLLATLEALDSAVERLDKEDELASRMRVLQMACLRELGRLEDALAAWRLLDRPDTPVPLRREGLAEAGRLLVAGNQARQAAALLREQRYAPLLSEPDPEIDLARLEVALALARSEPEAERSRWQKAAAQLAKEIDERHGPAAGRRANQLIRSLVPQDQSHGNTELLARLADDLYARRQIDDALAAYDKAAAAASAAGSADQEFALRYKAALIEQRQQDHAAAAARFAEIAANLPDHPQAAEAHLVACWNQAQQARSDEAARTAYKQLLEEHLERWPETASADQTALWLGQWHQANKAWLEAFEAFATVRSSAPHFGQAVAGAATCARQQLATAAAEDTPREASAKKMYSYFQGIASQRDDENRSTASAGVAAVAAAEIALEYLPSGHAVAEKMLDEVLTDSEQIDEPWRHQAAALRVAAIAGQAGRRDAAEQLIDSLANRPGELLSLLRRLSTASRKASPRLKKDLAALQLGVIERLSATSTSLADLERQELERLRAESLATAGRRQEALQAYSALAKALPDNGGVQEAYAELLAEADDDASREAALALWRKIAAKSPPRSERWCKAKYAVALLQLRSGERDAAATLCRYLLTTPPGLSETGWQERFEQLLAKCEQ